MKEKTHLCFGSQVLLNIDFGRQSPCQLHLGVIYGRVLNEVLHILHHGLNHPLHHALKALHRQCGWNHVYTWWAHHAWYRRAHLARHWLCNICDTLATGKHIFNLLLNL